MSNKNINEEATGVVDNLLAKSWVQTAGAGFKAGVLMVQVLAPATLCAYLTLKYNDKIVVGLGVASGLYALISLAKTSYKAVTGSKKRR